MDIKLFIQAITKMILGVVLVGLLIFLPAGTLFFFNGWLLMMLLFIPMFFAGIVLMFKKPELLKRRLNAKEKQNKQSIIVKLSGIMFIVGFVVAGLDFRFSWSNLTNDTIKITVLIFILAYLLYAEVIRENEYLSRTIELQKNHKIIDTGLYGIVRHPMYFSSVILFLSMPVILGSIWSFLIFLLYPIIILYRIKFEEEFLEKELKGYIEYKQKVKYRLIPFIW